ncbi:MAG: flagellar basal body protein [Gemmatimonas sp.]
MTALSTAVSALVAQQANVAVIADNVANWQTTGYTAKEAKLVSTEPAGVTVGAIVRAPVPDVDLAHEFVGLMLARTAYEAALKVVSTSEQMDRDFLASV